MRSRKMGVEEGLRMQSRTAGRVALQELVGDSSGGA